MQIYEVEMPKDRYSRYYDPCPLSNYDFKDLEGADLVVYWYGCGSYEGDGELIARKDDKWYYHGLGHCSCYGPTEKFSFSNGVDSYEDFKGSGEWKIGMVPIIEKLKELGV